MTLQLFFLVWQGITTYEYVVAMRAMSEAPAGSIDDDNQNVIYSPSGSATTGFSGGSSLGLQYKGAWCTPPRVFVDHQVHLWNIQFLLSICWASFCMSLLIFLNRKILYLIEPWCWPCKCTGGLTFWWTRQFMLLGFFLLHGEEIPEQNYCFWHIMGDDPKSFQQMTLTVL